MLAAARVVKAQLLRLAEAAPPEIGPRLLAASACYDRIAALLGPAVTGQNGDHYREFIGDLAKQDEHARTVLRPIRAELVAAAGEIAVALRARGPRTEMVMLKGRKYRLEWTAPDQLEELGLHDVENTPLRTSTGPYSGHVHPLYNIHCNVGPDVAPGQVARDAWPRYWRELAEGLPVEHFALVAFAGDSVAGFVRFFPASEGRLRHVDSGTDARTLVMGAAGCDPTGVTDGLDLALVQRVADYARSHDYREVQAIGWSELRIFAVWGESYPASVYERCGFRKVDPIPAPPPRRAA